MTPAEFDAFDGTETRIDAGWIATVDADNRILEDHTLIIGEGQILDCLPTQTANRTHAHMAPLDRRKHILIPGLVNAHTHLAMNLLRGIGSDKPLMEWLQQFIWPVEAAHLSPEFVRDGTELALAESLLGGVTCVNDMYFFPNIIASACQRSGIRATVGLAIMDIPTAWASTIEEYFEKGLDVHDQLRDDPLVRTSFAPHAPYTVPAPALEKINTLSSELDVQVHMHVHETRAEVDDFITSHGIRPIQLLDRAGLLNPSMMAVHLTQMLDAEIALLAEAGTHAIHCPESNLKLASGACPVHRLLEAGVNVAIGTDGAASNNDLDMFGEMRSAALLAKHNSGDASALPATTALRMATINGAEALGIDGITGSLEKGKSADIACIEPDLSMLPMHDVTAQLVYATNRERVCDVWVAGKRVVANRQIQTLDTDRLHHAASRWAEKLRMT